MSTERPSVRLQVSSEPKAQLEEYLSNKLQQGYPGKRFSEKSGRVTPILGCEGRMGLYNRAVLVVGVEAGEACAVESWR